VIELIMDGMDGKPFDDYRERLARTTTAMTPMAARQFFLSCLAIAVGPEGPHSKEQIADRDLREEREYLIASLPALLNDHKISDALCKNGGIVDKLCNHVLGDIGRERREERRQFSLKDLPLSIPVSDLTIQARELYSDLLSAEMDSEDSVRQ